MAAEESICSSCVTRRRKKTQLRRFLSFDLSRTDEMLQQPDSGPSQNNSRKCQTSVGEMRPGEEHILCPPPPGQRMRTSNLQNLLLPDTKSSAVLRERVDGCSTAARFLSLHTLS